MPPTGQAASRSNFCPRFRFKFVVIGTFQFARAKRPALRSTPPNGQPGPLDYLAPSHSGTPYKEVH